MSKRILSKLNQRDFKTKPLIGKHKLNAVHRYVHHKAWVRARDLARLFKLSALEIRSLQAAQSFSSVGPAGSDHDIEGKFRATRYLRSNSFMAHENPLTMMRRYYAKKRARRLHLKLTPLEELYNAGEV
jgi:hypothetical protein